MLHSQPCGVCGKDRRALYKVSRFDLHVCWDCIRHTQLVMVKIMGREFVDQVLSTNQVHLLYYISDGQFNVDSTTSTSAQGWEGWRE